MYATACVHKQFNENGAKEILRLLCYFIVCIYLFLIFLLLKYDLKFSFIL